MWRWLWFTGRWLSAGGIPLSPWISRLVYTFFFLFLTKSTFQSLKVVGAVGRFVSRWCSALWLLTSPFLVARLCSVSLVVRFLLVWLTEHKRATGKGDVNNHIAQHHLTYSTNYFQRLTLESWFTYLERTPLNRCQPLPAPYKRLIHGINITNEPNRTT